MSDAEEQGRIVLEAWMNHYKDKTVDDITRSTDRDIADALMELRHQIELIENRAGLGRVHDECDCTEGSPCRFHAGIAIHLSYAAKAILEAESELRL